MKRIVLALLVTGFAFPAFAQTPTTPAIAAMVCANNTVVPTPTNGQFFYVQCDSNGKLITTSSGGGSPGGANTNVQFNDAGSFGGTSGFTFNKTTGQVSITPTGGNYYTGLSIQTPAVSPDVSHGSILLNGNTNPSAIGAHQTSLVLVGADGASPTVEYNTYGIRGAVISYAANGTQALPTALTNDFETLRLSYRGYDGGTWGQMAYFGAFAAENFTPTAHGSYFSWSLTPKSAGAATPIEAMRLQASGGLSIGDPTYNVTDPGNGVLSVKTGFQVNGTAVSGNVLRGNGTNFVSAILAAGDISGLGTAATVNTGTSGATIPLNNGGFTQSGAANFSSTFQINSNTITWPAAAITVARTDAAQTFTGAQTIANIVGSKSYPASDSTTAIQITKADASTVMLDVDTTNSRVGINGTPLSAFQVFAAATSASIGSISLAPSTTTASSTTINLNTDSASVGSYFATGSTAANTNLSSVPLSVNFRGGGNATGGSIYGTAANAPAIFFTGGSTFANERMRILGTAASFVYGGPDAAAPGAVTFSVQSVVAGNANVAGANTTFNGSLSNGNGAGGDFIFQTTASVASSGVQNSEVAALTIKGGTQNIIGSATTDASASSGSGALQVAGGASIAKRFWIPAITASAGLQTAVLCQSSGGEMIADSVACLASSARFKNIHGSLSSDVIDKFMKLPIKVWAYKPEGIFKKGNWTRDRIGPIAEDVERLDPRLVEYDTEGNVRAYSTEQLLAYTIKVVQVQQSEITELKRRIR